MDKKSLVKFNVQYPKYALKNGDVWDVPKSNGDARSISLEANTSQKNIYGNGVITCSIVNDKGKTGTLTVNTVPTQYEVDMGRKRKTATGYAEIKQSSEVPHCLYFETCEITENPETGKQKKTVAKTWLYNATTTRPSESYTQDEDDINESTFDIPLTVRGIALLNDDETPVVEDGVPVLAFSMTVTPDDEGYDTFGDAVVLPKLPAIVPPEVEPTEG